MLSLILFWKRIKRQFLRFEKRFFANLNEKELSTVVRTADSQAKHLHLARLTVSATVRW